MAFDARVDVDPWQRALLGVGGLPTSSLDLCAIEVRVSRFDSAAVLSGHEEIQPL